MFNCKDEVNALYSSIDYLTSYDICSKKQNRVTTVCFQKTCPVPDIILMMYIYSSVSTDCIQIFLEPLGMSDCKYWDIIIASINPTEWKVWVRNCEVEACRSFDVWSFIKTDLFIILTILDRSICCTRRCCTFVMLSVNTQYFCEQLVK